MRSRKLCLINVENMYVSPLMNGCVAWGQNIAYNVCGFAMAGH